MNFEKKKVDQSNFCVFRGDQIFMHQSVYIQGSLNKFPDFFRMGTFIDSTHMKLKSPSK